jgi:hypothetical protein
VSASAAASSPAAVLRTVIYNEYIVPDEEFHANITDDCNPFHILIKRRYEQQREGRSKLCVDVSVPVIAVTADAWDQHAAEGNVHHTARLDPSGELAKRFTLFEAAHPTFKQSSREDIAPGGQWVGEVGIHVMKRNRALDSTGKIVELPDLFIRCDAVPLVAPALENDADLSKGVTPSSPTYDYAPPTCPEQDLTPYHPPAAAAPASSLRVPIVSAAAAAASASTPAASSTAAVAQTVVYKERVVPDEEFQDDDESGDDAPLRILIKRRYEQQREGGTKLSVDVSVPVVVATGDVWYQHCVENNVHYTDRLDPSGELAKRFALFEATHPTFKQSDRGYIAPGGQWVGEVGIHVMKLNKALDSTGKIVELSDLFIRCDAVPLVTPENDADQYSSYPHPQTRVYRERVLSTKEYHANVPGAKVFKELVKRRYEQIRKTGDKLRVDVTVPFAFCNSGDSIHLDLQEFIANSDEAKSRFRMFEDMHPSFKAMGEYALGGEWHGSVGIHVTKYNLRLLIKGETVEFPELFVPCDPVVVADLSKGVTPSSPTYDYAPSTCPEHSAYPHPQTRIYEEKELSKGEFHVNKPDAKEFKKLVTRRYEQIRKTGNKLRVNVTVPFIFSSAIDSFHVDLRESSKYCAEAKSRFRQFEDVHPSFRAVGDYAVRHVWHGEVGIHVTKVSTYPVLKRRVVEFPELFVPCEPVVVADLSEGVTPASLSYDYAAPTCPEQDPTPYHPANDEIKEQSNRNKEADVDMECHEHFEAMSPDSPKRAATPENSYDDDKDGDDEKEYFPKGYWMKGTVGQLYKHEKTGDLVQVCVPVRVDDRSSLNIKSSIGSTDAESAEWGIIEPTLAKWNKLHPEYIRVEEEKPRAVPRDHWDYVLVYPMPQMSTSDVTSYPHLRDLRMPMSPSYNGNPNVVLYHVRDFYNKIDVLQKRVMHAHLKDFTLKETLSYPATDWVYVTQYLINGHAEQDHLTAVPLQLRLVLSHLWTKTDMCARIQDLLALDKVNAGILRKRKNEDAAAATSGSSSSEPCPTPHSSPLKMRRTSSSGSRSPRDLTDAFDSAKKVAEKVKEEADKKAAAASAPAAAAAAVDATSELP